MRAATHGCNEGSIEAGWLGQSHLPVMLNYVPTTTTTAPMGRARPAQGRRGPRSASAPDETHQTPTTTTHATHARTAPRERRRVRLPRAGRCAHANGS